MTTTYRLWSDSNASEFKLACELEDADFREIDYTTFEVRNPSQSLEREAQFLGATIERQ